MKFTFDGQEFSIQFRYDKAFPPIGGVPDYREGVPLIETETTTCFIWQERPDGFADVRLCIGTGRVRRHPKDRPDREVGRKKALAKALELQGRGFRTAAWKAYLGRKEQGPGKSPAQQVFESYQGQRFVIEALERVGCVNPKGCSSFPVPCACGFLMGCAVTPAEAVALLRQGKKVPMKMQEQANG